MQFFATPIEPPVPARVVLGLAAVLAVLNAALIAWGGVASGAGGMSIAALLAAQSFERMAAADDLPRRVRVWRGVQIAALAVGALFVVMAFLDLG